jgi:hypothetical protein
MKSLLTFAVVAVILYVAWDMFGGSLIGSLEKATGGARESLSSIVSPADEADFELRYDAASGKLIITTPRDPTVNARSEVSDLSLRLRSRTSDVPHVRLIYDASAFADVDQQNAFERDVRAQVERAKGRLSLTVTGRPGSL